jgi:hypothetical protein
VESRVFRICTWGLESFGVAVDSDPALVLLEGQLHPVPVAVVEVDPGCPDLDRPGSQVQVEVQVPVQKLDGKVVLG